MREKDGFSCRRIRMGLKTQELGVMLVSPGFSLKIFLGEKGFAPGGYQALGI
jgi:hypothetical protein